MAQNLFWNSDAPGRSLPRPFLKWVGGKGQLLPYLLDGVKRADAFGRYHEPFVGGGALFFELIRTEALKQEACLSDNNANLIDVYVGVRDLVDEVIAALLDHKARHGEEYFYEVRATVPTAIAARAARIIYLNRTCFNGLYRENSKGEFNVPFGKYANPKVCDEENLRACSAALSRAKIETRGFETVLDTAQPGDLVYFDPPYDPVSQTASFTAYNKDSFGKDAQKRLVEVFAKLSRKGVKAMLSNAATPFIEELYADYAIQEVMAKRSVNSRADRRGPVAEVIVDNFAQVA